MDFEVVEEPTDVETIATGNRIRELRRLYGKGRWRKMTGVARVRTRHGQIRLAEPHWYEAHGIGKKEFKRKRFLDEFTQGESAEYPVWRLRRASGIRSIPRAEQDLRRVVDEDAEKDGDPTALSLSTFPLRSEPRS
jgi:hypothetical protein